MLDKLKKNKYVPYIIIFISSLIISIIFFTINLSKYNEARIHIARIVSVKEILLDGIFPSFINQKYMNGFGYALNIFYGPITTYIPILISFITNNSILALKIFTFLTVLLSGFTMYHFLLKISNRRLVALLGAIIYIIAPYKLTNIYSRNAVGEYTAFIFIPIVFEGLYQILSGDKKKHYLIIIGAVGLILSHTITTIYVCLFSLIYIILNFKKILDKSKIKCLVIDMLIILLLTSFYLIPLLEHKAYGDYAIFNEDIMGSNGKNVEATCINILEFFKSEFADNELVFSFGIVILFSLILTPFCIKKLKNNKEYFNFLLLAFISLLMCTIAFPWFIMPSFLTIVQFAWRLEGFFIFFISFVCAVNIVTISEMIKDKKNILCILVILASFICSFFGTVRYYDSDNFEKDRKFESNIINSETISPYGINREYLPTNAIKNISYIENRENGVYVLDGKANIINENKNGLKMNFTAENVENATLELPYIFYHGYTVKLNGKKLDTFESENGFLCIKLSDSGDVSIEYTGTILEIVGYVISGISLLGILIYLLIKTKGEKIEK